MPQVGSIRDPTLKPLWAQFCKVPQPHRETDTVITNKARQLIGEYRPRHTAKGTVRAGVLRTDGNHC